MLTLPEALLLFGLHDDRGTIHPAAYLALDHGLRAAVLSELRLRGLIQTKSDGSVRVHPSADANGLDSTLLRHVFELVAEAPGQTAGAWLDHLAVKLPDLRAKLIAGLQIKGILAAGDLERANLPSSAANPMADGAAEADMMERVAAALDEGDAMPVRLGVLIGLVRVCNLEGVVFGKRASDAQERGDWVLAKDTLCRAAMEAVARAEGTWES